MTLRVAISSMRIVLPGMREHLGALAENYDVHLAVDRHVGLDPSGVVVAWHSFTLSGLRRVMRRAETLQVRAIPEQRRIPPMRLAVVNMARRHRAAAFLATRLTERLLA
jgi:hypothetical protein